MLAGVASTPDGLTSQEAAQRLATNGPNELTESRGAHPLAIFLGLQVWGHHSPMLGGLLKTSPVPFATDLGLIALGAVPLVVLEMIKVVRHRRRVRRPQAQGPG